ncbi:MAG: hypothetical protein HYR55_11870 [Acidobacteria bacterium]|nr:hypothetical protein [Acidobacteriota bacterium]MBI3655864.1 hypothetical protein [Acidobacteriota bacterium]
MRQLLGLVLMAFCLLAFQCHRAMAACTAILQPTAAYTMGTEICTIGTVGGTSTECKDSDNNVEAKFSNGLSVRQVPNGWSTWSAPPESETDTPMIGFNTTATLTITMAAGYLAGTAGMEIENNVFTPAMPITVQFFDLAGAVVSTQTRSVLGQSGARLFAVTCDEELINKIVITAQATAQGFAIAKVRADSFVINRNPSAGPSSGSYSIPEGAKSNAQ